MKPLEELINTIDPGWILVKKWIEEATNKVEVLPKDKKNAEKTLFRAQVTTRSTIGAVIYETGGILIDNGWIRILGSGSFRLERNLIEWNKGKSFLNFGEQPSFLLVADDIIGGFFAINSGGIDKENIGKVFYFAPYSLTWECTNFGYSNFLIFCFQGDLNAFYKGYRWDNWEKDIHTLDGNEGIGCFPFLWTKEGADINMVSRKVTPIQELWDLY